MIDSDCSTKKYYVCKPHLPTFLYAILLALVSTQLSYAAETADLPAIVVDDLKYVVTSPSHWESDEWNNLGWATLAVAGTAIIADRPVRDFMRKQTPGNTFIAQAEHFGLQYAIGTVGVFYLTGVLTDNDKPVQVAQDAVAASLISAGINQTIKIVVNRSRPYENQGVYDFKGYAGRNNNSSFPSGHTTEAFTLAAVISSHYDETWVSYVAYSIAGMVGVARMYHDAHFASDVTASALIGIYVGKSVVNHNRSLHSQKVVLLPIIGHNFAGMQIVGNF